MVNTEWQKVREIFDSALCRKPEDRQKYIVAACGADKSLLAEVESLFDSLDSAESFLETPAIAELEEKNEAEPKTLVKGQWLNHYEITEQIGTGGMGEVYLAQDRKLDRQVAVKILNQQFSRHESNLHRFRREAKAASALNHPNILVIHEIGADSDTHFIVSEYVKGKTLREVLREKTLNLSEILDIAAQIANALSAAHEVHLVHRDIKPENIMIRPDGYVKILDFGLAKLVERENKSILGLDETTLGQNQTGQGVILGTVNYMSPEQAKGEKIDERTDIFSLGAVIYEMLAGQTPFAGETVSETFANLIHLEPRPLSRFFTNLPPEFEQVAAKMLQKNREKRYQTVKDLLADLKDLRKNVKADEKLERFAVPKVWQNKSDDFENSEQPVNAFQAYQFWRIRYQQISPPDLIKSHELLDEAVRFDPDFALAHTSFVFQWIQEAIIGLRTPGECFPQAKDALDRAAGLNPDLTEFYAAAGFVEMVCDWNFQKAERKLNKALELNSYHAFANNLLGQVFMFQSQPEKAEPYLQRALEIEPTGLHYRTVLMMSYFLGRNFQKSIKVCEQMLALYPRYFIAAQVRCWSLEQSGREQEAVAEYEKILNEPHGEIAHRWMGYAYAVSGNREKALETAARLEAESREHYRSPIHQAQIYAGLNDKDKAFEYLEKGIENRDPWMVWIAADPRYDNLRGDSRFDELVMRVGLKGVAGVLQQNIGFVDTASPNGNKTLVLPTATGEANLKIIEKQNNISRQIKQQKPLAASALLALLIAAFALGFYFFKPTNAAVGSKKSIAVLPLIPINTANRDEIYEYGIADTLIHRLNLMRGFIVRPLSATRQYAGVAQDPLAAGREQQADYILAANYQIAGGKIRITAQLFNVANGQLENTYKIEKEASDIFAMQDEVANEFGNQLQTHFVTASSNSAAKRGTDNEEAHRLYLQGINLTAKRNQAEAKKAIERFEQAIRLDPNFTLAYVGLAHAFSATGTLYKGNANEAYEKARAALNKAAELNPNSADFYTARGDLKIKYEWDFAGAEKDLRTAIELEPNNGLAHARYAMWLNHHGRFDEALDEIEIALEIDPNSLDYSRERGRFCYFARRYDEAIVHLERVLELDEKFNTAYAWLWRSYELKGDYNGAFKWLMKHQKLTNPERTGEYQNAYETGGWESLRRKMLEFEKRDEEATGNYYQIARQLALLGEKDEAFEYLNKAIEKRQTQMCMLKVEPTFDSLHNDPRFDELLRRVGF